jgi:hypothetical protein
MVWWWVLCVLCTLLSGGAAIASATTCPGDCDGSREVTIDEILLGVNIAIGTRMIEDCRVFDGNGDGEVTVDEIIAAVSSALLGCPEPSSPSPTPTATPPSNQVPVITPVAVYRAYPGFAIALPVHVVDPEDDDVHCLPDSLPPDATWTGTPGQLEWTPNEDHIGPAYVPFTCTDDGDPPAAASGVLTLVVQPLDSCTEPICDPAAGCSSPLPAIETPCCGEPPPAIIEPDADCPEGLVLLISEIIEGGGFRPLRNCDWKWVINQAQQDAQMRLRLRTRCISLDDRARVRARLETAERQPVFDREYLVPFNPSADGYVDSPVIPLPVNTPRPFFDIEGSEGNLTVTLRDALNQQVSRSLRLRLTFTPVPEPLAQPPQR